MKDSQIELIKKIYPPGTRIKLDYMEDEFAVPRGTLGTVEHIDDEGQIHMKWDNGRTLALVYGIDKFEKINEKKTERER